MTIKIVENESIALFMQLASRRDDYFVRAKIIDETDTEIVASPVTLTNQGSGLYTSFGVDMPAGVSYLVCQYEIYSDAGFTKIVKNEAPDADFFKRDTNVVPKLDQIIAKLSGLALPGAAITVQIDSGEIETIVEDLKETRAILAGEELTAKVSGDTIAAELEDDTIDAKINCD